MDRRKRLEKKEEGEVKDKAERPEDYRPFTQQDEAKPGFHDSADFMTIDQRETMRELDDSQLAGPAPPPVSSSTSTSTASVATRDVHMADAQVSAAATLPSANRKRGRPPRARGKTVPSPPPQRKQAVVVDEEEDVCFICFDGGSLVLCDRRGCPKAYHPTCIKRDEAFFRSKAKWDCGWHICSSCQKASYYMCYTCTYSLCKRCTKGADYVCVRDNKGFCGICMKTIMLIENVTVGNVDQQVQVDFDDKTSWEYLFKVYWVYLKDKESLTIDELTNAKNPWKGDELPKARNSWKRNGYAARKEILSGEHNYANNGEVSCLDNCRGNGDGTPSKRRKTNDQSDPTEKKSLDLEKSTVQKAIPMPEGTTWATKALLEFVSYMKNGDQSMLSRSDVQDLLLEYIKRNNLRDPRQNAEVACDARLTNLFRKPRVGHLEMLKLLEYHFLTKEQSPPDNNVSTTAADALRRQLGAGCSDSQLAMGNGRQHITDKKMNEKGSVINPIADEYAAIDAHNINLLYLKCNLMEKLLDDAESFHEKVVGSFVRIRIAVGDIKQDVYRLVQVVGTRKVDEPYKVGSKTSNMKLEILNLEKEEVISIDGISDQDFSEEECRRLRETVKCGLIKPLKVGEIQEKAVVLQPVKVSDCLEAEILQLNNLRDRASEKGHRKERREWVEKLELLKSPKELERRLLDIPSVHMDQKMDPTCVSGEDTEDKNGHKQGDHVGLNDTGFARKGIELNSSPGECDLNDLGHRALKTLAAASEQVEMNSRVDLEGTLPIKDRGNDSFWSRGAVTCGLSIPNSSKNQLGDAGSAPVTSESVPGVASSVTPSLFSGNEISVSNFETENLWNYQDPSGKIQGPFSMVQLRKWSEINIFPDDFRVWRINEKQQDSILLTDALIGRFPVDRQRVLPKEATVPYKDADEKREQGTNVTQEDNKRADNDQKPLQNDSQIDGSSSDELVKSGLDSHSISWIKAAGDARDRPSLAVLDMPVSTGQSQICVSLPAPSSSRKSNEATVVNEREGVSNPSNTDMDSPRTTSQTIAKVNGEKRAESDGLLNNSTNGWDPNSSFLSMLKSEQSQKFDFSNMPITAPMQPNEGVKNQVAENKQPASTNVTVQDLGPPSWSTASSLVIAGRQVPEVAADWLSFSSAPAKRSVEQWDINLVSPSEGTRDHAVPTTSGMDQLTLSSTSHPTIDAPSWHSMVPEPTEFCSLVDESVSDLLAEVEAMESLNGLPSPTSKLRYDLELAPGSDDDCFSPIERFNPNPNPNPPPGQPKGDTLNSTTDIQIPTQFSVVEESLRLSLMPSQPTTTNEPLAVSHMAPIQHQGIIQNEPLRASSQIASQKSFNGDSKHSEVSVNQWDMRLDIRPLESNAKQRQQAGSDIQAPVGSTVSQWEDGPNKHLRSTVDASRRTNRGGVPQGNAIQQQGSTNSGVSTGNWGSQSRHGSESRHSGQRDHRNHSHSSRDSGSGSRDRSSWNRQPTYGSAGNGGGSFRGPSKGQRVCKFYESGHCKKGASCSYWHP